MGSEKDGTPSGPIVEHFNTNIGQQESIPCPFYLDFGSITSSCPDIEIVDVVVENKIGEEEGFPLIVIEYGECASAFNNETEFIRDKKVLNTYSCSCIISMTPFCEYWLYIR